MTQLKVIQNKLLNINDIAYKFFSELEKMLKELIINNTAKQLNNRARQLVLKLKESNLHKLFPINHAAEQEVSFSDICLFIATDGYYAKETQFIYKEIKFLSNDSLELHKNFISAYNSLSNILKGGVDCSFYTQIIPMPSHKLFSIDLNIGKKSLHFANSIEEKTMVRVVSTEKSDFEFHIYASDGEVFDGYSTSQWWLYRTMLENKTNSGFCLDKKRYACFRFADRRFEMLRDAFKKIHKAIIGLVDA